MALAILAFGLSVLALSIAATILTGGIAAAAIIAPVAIGTVSTQVFFKTYNISSKKIISDNAILNASETTLQSVSSLFLASFSLHSIHTFLSNRRTI